MFISIEGIDGSGKSTVTDALTQEYPEAVFTQEPDDSTKYGKHVREVISDDSAPQMAVFFAFLEDHAVHVENKIKPALQNNKMVISDRYIDSRYAYQESSLNNLLDVDALQWIRDIQEAGWSIMPDLTILLDTDPEEGLKRINTRNKSKERFENLEKQHKVRDTYLELANIFKDRFTVIDTTSRFNESNKDCKQRVINQCIKTINRELNNTTTQKH